MLHRTVWMKRFIPQVWITRSDAPVPTPICDANIICLQHSKDATRASVKTALQLTGYMLQTQIRIEQINQQK